VCPHSFSACPSTLSFKNASITTFLISIAPFFCL
jgi:hypothetical protein